MRHRENFHDAQGGGAVNPVLPTGWNWIAVKNSLWNGISVSAFLRKRIFYDVHEVIGSYPLVTGSEVEVISENDAITAVGIRTGKEIILFFASDEIASGAVRVNNETISHENVLHLKKGEAVMVRLIG